MSAFDTVSKRSGRAILMRLGQSVTYRGAGDEITTAGIIELVVDLFGEGTQVGDDRWQCSLLTEDVSDPRRGDRVTDENGDIWMLQEKMPLTDRWVQIWAVTKR